MIKKVTTVVAHYGILFFTSNNLLDTTLPVLS